MIITIKNKISEKQISFELADCIGVSEKQANYGNSCKEKIFKNFGSMAVDLMQNKTFSAINDKYSEQIDKLKTNTDAKFWIDSQFKTIQNLIKEML